MCIHIIKWQEMPLDYLDHPQRLYYLEIALDHPQRLYYLEIALNFWDFSCLKVQNL
jgi:hypothetical protein